MTTETDAELETLQQALDHSYLRAGIHLRSIFLPEHRLSAAQLAENLAGVFVMDLATVTADGAPFVSPVDGYFHRGRIWFGLPAGSVRARHLRARPRVSATLTRDEEMCLIVHGTAHEVQESHPDYPAYERCVRELYGPVFELSAACYADREGTDYNAWIEPRRIFASRL